MNTSQSKVFHSQEGDITYTRREVPATWWDRLVEAVAGLVAKPFYAWWCWNERSQPECARDIWAWLFGWTMVREMRRMGTLPAIKSHGCRHNWQQTMLGTECLRCGLLWPERETP